MKPWLEIVHQPPEYQTYRYTTEKRSDSQIHTTVKVHNYESEAVVSCHLVYHDSEEPHPHWLSRAKQERHISTTTRNGLAEFRGMAILQANKNVMISNSGNTLRLDKDRLWKHMVRIKYTAYNENEEQICDAVTSTPIYNNKSVRTKPLHIFPISFPYGTLSGGDEVTLLVHKVNKNEIVVRLFELDENGQTVWSKEVIPKRIHFQVAIIFETPAYKDLTVQDCRKVNVELWRRGDNKRSNPVTFTYSPYSQEFHQGYARGFEQGRGHHQLPLSPVSDTTSYSGASNEVVPMNKDTIMKEADTTTMVVHCESSAAELDYLQQTFNCNSEHEQSFNYISQQPSFNHDSQQPSFNHNSELQQSFIYNSQQQQQSCNYNLQHHQPYDSQQQQSTNYDLSQQTFNNNNPTSPLVYGNLIMPGVINNDVAQNNENVTSYTTLPDEEIFLADQRTFSEELQLQDFEEIEFYSQWSFSDMVADSGCAQARPLMLDANGTQVQTSETNIDDDDGEHSSTENTHPAKTNNAENATYRELKIEEKKHVKDITKERARNTSAAKENKYSCDYVDIDNAGGNDETCLEDDGAESSNGLAKFAEAAKTKAIHKVNKSEITDNENITKESRKPDEPEENNPDKEQELIEGTASVEKTIDTVNESLKELEISDESGNAVTENIGDDTGNSVKTSKLAKEVNSTNSENNVGRFTDADALNYLKIMVEITSYLIVLYLILI